MKRPLMLIFGLFGAILAILGIINSNILYGKIMCSLPIAIITIPCLVIFIVTNFGKRTFGIIIKRQVGIVKSSNVGSFDNEPMFDFYPAPKGVTDINRKNAAIEFTYVRKKKNGTLKKKRVWFGGNTKELYEKPAVVLRKIGFIYCLDTKDTLNYKFTENDLEEINKLTTEIENPTN